MRTDFNNERFLKLAHNIRPRYLAGDDDEDEQNGSDDGGDEDDDEDQHECQTNHEGDDDDDDNDFDEDSYHRQVKELQKKAISRFAELKQQNRARTNTE